MQVESLYYIGYQQITAAQIASVYTAENRKTTITFHESHILCLDKRTGANIGQINDVNATGASSRQYFERIVRIAHQNLHPRRRLKKISACRIGL